MPWANNRTIDSLRMLYNAALSAHRDRHRVLIEARIQGVPIPLAAVEDEMRARQQLEEARAKLLAAITKAVNGDDPPQA
jgi:hypothetical protein